VLTTPGTGLGNLAVTQPYVDTAVANLGATVVHLTGTETITGTKQFAVSPRLPAPVGANDATNKGYVDAAVSNVGSGAYVAIAGGTMTGPLTLPADPTAPNQAADRHYVDNGLAVKADLINATVPPNELGAGVASSATCLNGNSTWGSCGSGAPAGITYATTALNWTQGLTTSLVAGSAATVTLSPCPVGIDTSSGAGYDVYINDSSAEAVAVTAGTCTSGASSGTITFTPFFSHSSYVIQSASSGIQETINAACGVSSTTYANVQCNVTIPANGPYISGFANHAFNDYNVYGTIFFHANQSTLSGYGVSMNCLGRGACLQVGDLVNSNHSSANFVNGLSFRSPTNHSSSPAYAGVNITNTLLTSNYATITTATAHGFRPGDMVTILFTDDAHYWGDAVVTDCGSGATSAACTGTSTTFRYARTEPNIASQPTPGVVALAYTAILDNGNSTHFIGIQYDLGGEAGTFNNFFDMWDDENATIDHFNNNAISLNPNANWTGSFVFSAGNQNHQVAPVITLRDSNITANYSNCATDYNSNGLYVENTVCQASGPWQIYSANTTGNYAGAYIRNIYSESGAAQNPLSPARSPFPGLGIAGLIAGSSSGASSFQVVGNGSTEGAFYSGGTGSTPYSYFIVANDTTANTQTSPMQILNWLSTGSDSIPVRWPRVANGKDAITYDVIRIATPAGVGAVYPYNGGCPGGSGGVCGYVAKGLTQSAACSGGLVCTYTDNGSLSTFPYTIKQGNYNGALNFWPGSLVSVNRSVTVDLEMGNSVGVGLSGNPLELAHECTGNGAASAGGYTTCLASATSFNNSVPNQTATIVTDGDANTGGTQLLTKGRLNFNTTPFTSIQPHHIITLIDSQPALTQATTGYRPPASVNDTWIGTDVASGGAALGSGQLAFGAPVSITNYIAQTGDGIHANWLERLSASLKEFNVPVKFDQSVTVAGLSNGCLNVTSGVIASTGSPCGSGGGGGNVSSIFGRTGTIVAANGDYTVSQVTGAAVDAAVVHNTGAETIAGAKTFTSAVTMGGSLLLPQGNGYVPAPGGIGLDTAAGLPVVNIGGTTARVALTSSNISGQAGTALALAAVPTQCSGSFATGIAANGNANCTTPDVIQLPETTPPAGIPNWGVFWFDAQTHAPHFIENNGQAVQLGLTNLFNSDPGGDPADNLEERNGSSVENLRVYSSYTNNTTWTRMSLGSETIGSTNYNVLRSEDATSGNAPSLGMHIGSAIKWVFSSDGTFKPNSDNSYDMGTDSGQAMRSVFTKTSFNMYNSGRQDFEFVNDPTNGTTLNQLAVYNSSATGVQTAATSSTDGVVGVVSGGAGTSNKAVITWAGFTACNFDAANPMAGDYVVASTTQAGKCHDTGSTTRPSGVQAIGRIEGGGLRVSLAAPSGSGTGGAVNSVFGRSGAVTAASGDYSVSQVTGAAADSTVVHLAGAETITGAKTFSSNVTLGGNLNVAGTINQTGSGPTQWSGQEWTGTTVTVPSGMAFSLGVGSDNTFKCQLSTGASCMPGSGGMVWPGTGIPNSTGSAWGTSYGTSGSGATLALTASPVFTGAPTVPGYVPNSTTVNGHGLSTNVTVSASDLTTGTLPHAQLPTLVSGDIPNNAANTSGTAANLSGTPTLPNGTAATTQSGGDNSTKLATTAYVRSEIQMAWSCPVAGTSSTVQYCNWTLPAAITITGFDLSDSTAAAGCTTYPIVQLWDGTANAEVGSYSVAFTSGTNFFPQVTGSANVASGHFLRLKITTAAAGCTTSAAGIVGTVTYQMQN
jgi:hypothetical protein